MMIIAKKCSMCKIEKIISEYNIHASSKDGHRSACRACEKLHYNKEKKKIYHELNKERLNENKRIHYQKNRERLIQKMKEYKELNLQKIKESQKKYYDTNKDKIKTTATLYYSKNKIEINEKAKEYRSTRKLYINAYAKQYRIKNKDEIKKNMKEYAQSKTGHAIKLKLNQKRRALKNGATIEHFSAIEIFNRDRYICQSCKCKTSTKYKNSKHPKYTTLDHIIPLSKGGEHSRKNTQCFCHHCNCVKNNKQKQDQLLLFGR